jgi:hypothetical protein
VPRIFGETRAQRTARPMRLIALVFGLASACLQAQWINQRTAGIPRTVDGKPNLTAPVPKTLDGKPDLSGLWTLRQSSGGISQLKPGEIKPWAQALFNQREEDLFRDSPGIQCLPSGFVGGLAKIVQTPGLIVMLGEDLTYRQIFLDGRELPKDLNPAWMGYSVGHWDGDTLVVESTGYNDRTWIEGGYPHTENLRITERFRRRDFGHLDVDVTRSDPAIYEKSWTMKVEGDITADTELVEYVCAENEKDHSHLVGKRSDDTKNTIALAPEILVQYAGTYELNAKELSLPGPEIVDVNVALQDGVLQLGVGNGPKRPITPTSETSFTSAGGPVEFFKDDKGAVAYVVLEGVEGKFRANRKK